MNSKTAVILAGGKSTRMKRDKAFLDIDGEKLIDLIYRQLEPHFDEILISVSRKNADLFSNYKIVIDENEGEGPLRGILSGLKAASNETVFFIATDIPNIDLELLKSIISFSEEFDVIVPKTLAGHYEPLFAVYKKSLVSKIYSFLNSGRRKIIDLYPLCNTKFILMDNEEKLININTPEDYKRFLS